MLLDTHAAIWLVGGQALAPSAQDALDQALAARNLLVSAVTAWEVGLLVQRRRFPIPISADQWIERLRGVNGITFIALDTAAALESTRLPGTFHTDPADRFLVATAWTLDVPIVTRDARILGYAESGHVRAVEC